MASSGKRSCKDISSGSHLVIREGCLETALYYEDVGSAGQHAKNAIHGVCRDEATAVREQRFVNIIDELG